MNSSRTGRIVSGREAECKRTRCADIIRLHCNYNCNGTSAARNVSSMLSALWVILTRSRMIQSLRREIFLTVRYKRCYNRITARFVNNKKVQRELYSDKRKRFIPIQHVRMKARVAAKNKTGLISLTIWWNQL